MLQNYHVVVLDMVPRLTMWLNYYWSNFRYVVKPLLKDILYNCRHFWTGQKCVVWNQDSGLNLHNKHECGHLHVLYNKLSLLGDLYLQDCPTIQHTFCTARTPETLEIRTPSNSRHAAVVPMVSVFERFHCIATLRFLLASRP